MRKLKNAKSENIGPVVLYYNDLESLVKIFEEACDRIEIKTSDYQLENINEIKNLGKELITSFRIEGHDPHMYIEFNPSHIRLYISEETFTQVGVLETIKKFLSTRSRKWRWLTDSPAGGIASISVAVILMMDVEPTLYSIGGAALVITLAIIWLRSCVQRTISRYTIIYPLENRGEKKFFLQRNKDKIILTFFTAFVVSATTFLVTKWLSSVF